MNDPNDSTPLDTLLMLQVKGEMSPEQRAQLQKKMSANVEVLDYCLDYLLVSAGLEAACQEDEEAAKSRLQDTLKRHTVKLQHSTAQPWRRACKIAALLVLGCVVSFTVLRVLQQSRSQGLAQVINGLAAKWDNPSIATKRGTQLAQGSRYLVEGIAQLKMASGAKLLVQGPCRFSLNGKNRIHLTSGAINASVPKKARGFTVDTQNCTVVDYGTEFGIRAQADGQTEVHVFSGEVKLKAKQLAPGQAQEISLQANQAALVKASAPVKIKAADPAQFMRELPKKRLKAAPGKWLDLADVVGGGNGFGTGAVEQGIDVATGDKKQAPDKPTRDQRGAFIMLMDQRYIDGVFSPNSHLGDVTISATGLVFPECPQASSCYVGGVFNQMRQAAAGSEAPDCPVLSHHCNTGITFDLDRLRTDNPGVSIRGLDTRCRISGDTKEPDTTMDFWVLVDGVIRAHHPIGSNNRKEIPISIIFDTDARFLTLVTTCPGNTDDCWGIFAEPLLELNPTP
jgi:ferric-dicitrate binding protein FerR (iron transport regulator)